MHCCSIAHNKLPCVLLLHLEPNYSTNWKNTLLEILLLQKLKYFMNMMKTSFRLCIFCLLHLQLFDKGDCFICFFLA